MHSIFTFQICITLELYYNRWLNVLSLFEFKICELRFTTLLESNAVNKLYAGLLHKNVRWYSFYMLTWIVVSAETHFFYIWLLSTSRFNKFLYMLHLCVIRYFLFYKCCYLFQTQTEYLLLPLSYLQVFSQQRAINNIHLNAQ